MAGNAKDPFFAENELVVAREHLELVLDTLCTRLSLSPRPSPSVTASPELDLALIHALDGLTEWANQIRENQDLPASTPPVSDVDVLLFALRKDFQGRYGGWTPTMGKNRTGGVVIGAPNPKPHTSAEEPPQFVDSAPPVTAPADAGRGITVGILDTPFYEHPDLVRPIEPGGNAPLTAVLGDSVFSVAGHATFVADLIRREAPAATLAPRSILNPDTGRANAWDTAVKLMEFADPDLHIDILNLSFSCFTADGAPPLLLRRAIELLSPTMLVVAAAGNHGALSPAGNAGLTSKTPKWPGAMDGVVAVGARHGDERADFSPDLPWVDCSAPGDPVVAAYPQGLVLVDGGMPDPVPSPGYASWSGTSFAAATVSGAVAREMSEPGVHEAWLAFKRLLDKNDVVKPFVCTS